MARARYQWTHECLISACGKTSTFNSVTLKRNARWPLHENARIHISMLPPGRRNVSAKGFFVSCAFRKLLENNMARSSRTIAGAVSPKDEQRFTCLPSLGQFLFPVWRLMNPNIVHNANSPKLKSFPGIQSRTRKNDIASIEPQISLHSKQLGHRLQWSLDGEYNYPYK